MARRRRQVMDDALRFDAPAGDEKPAAPLEGEGYDDWLAPRGDEIVDEGVTVEFPDFKDKGQSYTLEDAAQPAPVPEAPPSRDYGNWRYTPWRGRDMWKNVKSGRTSFDEKAVRRYRHMDDVPAARPKK